VANMKLCGLWCASRALVARFLVGITGKSCNPPAGV